MVQQKLIKKVHEDALKYGLHIEMIDTLEDMFTVFANSRSIVVYENGECTLWNNEGVIIKSYKKIGAAVKALTKMEEII